MKTDGMLGILITLFIAIVIGAVLLGSLADNTATYTRTPTVANESIVVSNTTAKAVTYYQQGLVSVGNVWNGTSIVNTANYTVDLSAGTIKVNSGGAWPYNGATWKVNYVYYDSTYVKDSTAAAIVGLVTLFFALAVIAGVIYYVYKMLQDSGAM